MMQITTNHSTSVDPNRATPAGHWSRCGKCHDLTFSTQDGNLIAGAFCSLGR